jgi:hypothetical protein
VFYSALARGLLLAPGRGLLLALQFGVDQAL